MKLYIKDMLSPCCKTVVEMELEKLGSPYVLSDYGEVQIKGELNTRQRDKFEAALQKSGLELANDRKSILVEKIKSAIAGMVHDKEGLPKINFSDYLAEKLNHGYAYLSNVFSEVMDTTIEHYIIAQKIERIKVLLMEDRLTITEISYLLNYSSVAHLSNQFKKVTGLAPSIFKKVEQERRNTLGK